MTLLEVVASVESYSPTQLWMLAGAGVLLAWALYVVIRDYRRSR